MHFFLVYVFLIITDLLFKLHYQYLEISENNFYVQISLKLYEIIGLLLL